MRLKGPKTPHAAEELRIPMTLSWLACLALAFGLAAARGARLLEADLTDDAAYTVRIDGKAWLESAPLRLFAEGEWRDSATAGLIPTGVKRYDGSDILGSFSCVNVSWSAPGAELLLHTSLSVYADGQTAIFTQELPNGASCTDASKPQLPEGEELDSGAYPPFLSFPSFRASTGLLPQLGYVLWQGVMSKIDFGMNVPKHLQGLSSNGPVVLFDGTYSSLVVSPMDNFKNAVHSHSADRDTWEAGVSSEVEAAPAGFVHRTLLVAGTSIIGAMDLWGLTLRKAYGTRRLDEEDPVTNYLSYWTDNGAYYYGDKWGQAGGGGNVCNETAMKDVAGGLSDQNLLDAVKIWQLDDWWYPGPEKVWVHCVQNWTLAEPAFQHSLAELSRAVRTPWLLYVPFFCPENAYTRDFRFINSVGGPKQFAEPHPDDALAFYRMLFEYGLAGGMRGYENDFLNYNFLAMPYFRKTLGASNKWLSAINTAAMERGIPVQMCMALPSDLMASIQFPSVTNYRASGDYAEVDNYDIGGSSLLAFSLGLRPSKDNFWTHRPQSAIDTGKPWDAHSNPGSNCELNTIISTLSTGPVGIGDKAGDTNKTLLLRSVRLDGLVLQPSRPATYIDAMFWQRSLNHSRRGPLGHVWSTHAEISRGEVSTKAIWHYVLSIDVAQSWQLADVDLYPTTRAGSGWVARRWHRGHAPTPCPDGAPAVASGCLLAPAIRSNAEMPHLLNDRPMMVLNDTHAYDLLQLSPIEQNGWVLLGDTSRYTSVSSKRFKRVTGVASGLSVIVSGAPGEELDITALSPLSGGGHAVGGEEWTVVVKHVSFSGSQDMTVNFGTQPVHASREVFYL